ncbi:MAG: hypothetical protein ABIT71_11175 [Vicinamibacteraceae bacterium]
MPLIHSLISVALAALLLILVPGPVSAADPVKGWSVSALVPPDAPGSRRGMPLWLELRNDSAGARLVCLEGAIVALKSPDVTDGRARVIDTESCSKLTNFALVRAGHALSVVVYVKSRLGLVGPQAEPLVELVFYHHDPSDPQAERRRASIRWVGTIAAAQEAWRQLAGSR